MHHPVGRRCGGGFEIDSVLEAQAAERRKIADRKRRAELAAAELRMVDREQEELERRRDDTQRGEGSGGGKDDECGPRNSRYRGSERASQGVFVAFDDGGNSASPSQHHHKHRASTAVAAGATPFRGVSPVVMRKVTEARRKSMAAQAALDARERRRRALGFPAEWRAQADETVAGLQDMLRECVRDHGQQILSGDALRVLEEAGIAADAIGCNHEDVAEADRRAHAWQLALSNVSALCDSEGGTFAMESSVGGPDLLAESSFRSVESLGTRAPRPYVKPRPILASDANVDGLKNVLNTSVAFTSITEPPFAIDFAAVAQSVLAFAALPGPRGTNRLLLELLSSNDGQHVLQTLFWFAFAAFFAHDRVVAAAGPLLPGLGECITRLHWEARETSRVMDFFSDVVAHVVCFTFATTFSGLPRTLMLGSDDPYEGASRSGDASPTATSSPGAANDGDGLPATSSASVQEPPQRRSKGKARPTTFDHALSETVPWTIDFMDRVAMLVLLALRGELCTTAYLDHVRHKYFSAQQLRLLVEPSDVDGQARGLSGSVTSDGVAAAPVAATAASSVDSAPGGAPTTTGNMADEKTVAEGHTGAVAVEGESAVAPNRVIPLLVSQQEEKAFTIFNTSILDPEVARAVVREERRKERALERMMIAQRLRASSNEGIFHYASTTAEEANYCAQQFLAQQRPSSRVMLRRGVARVDFSDASSAEVLAKRKVNENEPGVVRCAAEAEVLAKSVCNPELEGVVLRLLSERTTNHHSSSDVAQTVSHAGAGSLSDRSLSWRTSAAAASVSSPGGAASFSGSYRTFAGAMRAMSRSYNQAQAQAHASWRRSGVAGALTGGLPPRSSSSTSDGTRACEGSPASGAQLGTYLTGDAATRHDSPVQQRGGLSLAKQRTLAMVRGPPSVYDAPSLADPLAGERSELLVGRRIPSRASSSRRPASRHSVAPPSMCAATPAAPRQRGAVDESVDFSMESSPLLEDAGAPPRGRRETLPPTQAPPQLRWSTPCDDRPGADKGPNTPLVAFMAVGHEGQGSHSITQPFPPSPIHAGPQCDANDTVVRKLCEGLHEGPAPPRVATGSDDQSNSPAAPSFATMKAAALRGGEVANKDLSALQLRAKMLRELQRASRGSGRCIAGTPTAVVPSSSAHSNAAASGRSQLGPSGASTLARASAFCRASTPAGTSRWPLGASHSNILLTSVDEAAAPRPDDANVAPEKVRAPGEATAAPMGLLTRRVNLRAMTPLTAACAQTPPRHHRAQLMTLTDQVPVVRKRVDEARKINASVTQRAKRIASEKLAQRAREVRNLRTSHQASAQAIAELEALAAHPLRRSEYVDEQLRNSPARRTLDPVQYRSYLGGSFLANEAKKTSDSMKQSLRKLDAVFAARKRRKKYD